MDLFVEPKRLYEEDAFRVKDCWKSDVEGLESNAGDIHRKLRQHNVRHISTFYCGNDIRSQATITQSYGDPQADSPPQALEGFQHYRMALLDVGRPLTMFKSTREMINVIADAMEGKAEVPLPAH
jgi:hypothetical protein